MGYFFSGLFLFGWWFPCLRVVWVYDDPCVVVGLFLSFSFCCVGVLWGRCGVLGFGFLGVSSICGV